MPSQIASRAYYTGGTMTHITVFCFSSYLVTQAKALTFICEAVLYRPKRTSGRSKKGDVAQEPLYTLMQVGEDLSQRPPPTLAGATVNLYIASLVDMWTDQKERGVINPSLPGYGHPRESSGMKGLIKITKWKKAETDRAQYKDRAESEWSVSAVAVACH